jgi:hypothetical protein
MKMVRKQVYITQEQNEKLKHIARARGLTEAEIVRQGIERLLQQTAGIGDRDAWEQELAFMRERARTIKGSTTKFRREDAYDEQGARVSG